MKENAPTKNPCPINEAIAYIVIICVRAFNNYSIG